MWGGSVIVRVNVSEYSCNGKAYMYIVHDYERCTHEQKMEGLRNVAGSVREWVGVGGGREGRREEGKGITEQAK